jgi:VIT1/CCC1 family predicted Fe2+/Mn2+ transporter
VGEIIKSMVYGGLDGTINILVIIISGITSNTSPSKILAMGLAANVGDCLGMGLGDYLSLKSEQAYIQSEKDREYYECEHMMGEEIKESI